MLRWAAHGCPDGVWQDYTYKHVAYGLADRGLMTVSRRRNSWQARLTDAGQYYADHGQFRLAESGLAKSAGQTVQAQQDPPQNTTPVTPQSLLADLQAADGIITIRDPPPGIRAAYRSAISRAATAGVVPSEFRLRHTGRDRGDLVIRLAETHGAMARQKSLPVIPVPETLDTCHPAVKVLRDSPGLVDVSDETRHRALLIAQAIAGECTRRGHGFGLAEDRKASFWIAVAEDRFSFTLFEEYDSREVPDDDQLATAKYSWQRIPSVVRDMPSGRLVLRMDSDGNSHSWADRRRWSIAQKLPALLEEVEAQAPHVLNSASAGSRNGLTVAQNGRRPSAGLGRRTSSSSTWTGCADRYRILPRRSRSGLIAFGSIRMPISAQTRHTLIRSGSGHIGRARKLTVSTRCSRRTASPIRCHQATARLISNYSCRAG